MMRPLALVIEPEPGNPHEVEGILNPAAFVAPTADSISFQESWGRAIFSRIGILRVLFDDSGDPCGVERLGIALEPQMPYELRPDGGGGCEDPA